MRVAVVSFRTSDDELFEVARPCAVRGRDALLSMRVAVCSGRKGDALTNSSRQTSLKIP